MKLNSSVYSNGTGTGYATYDDKPLTLPENDGCAISRSVTIKIRKRKRML